MKTKCIARNNVIRPWAIAVLWTDGVRIIFKKKTNQDAQYERKKRNDQRQYSTEVFDIINEYKNIKRGRV